MVWNKAARNCSFYELGVVVVIVPLELRRYCWSCSSSLASSEAKSFFPFHESYSWQFEAIDDDPETGSNISVKEWKPIIYFYGKNFYPRQQQLDV